MKPICETAMAEQRTILQTIPPGRMPFAIIGRLWHSPRRHSYGIRFAASDELHEQTLDDGTRWEPLEAHAVGGRLETAGELPEGEAPPRRPRGRPRKHPPGTKPIRSVRQIKVQPSSAADLDRWKLAAAAAGMRLSPWLAAAADRAAEEQLATRGPEFVRVHLSHSGEGCMHLLGHCREGSATRAAKLLARGRIPRGWQAAHARAVDACSEGAIVYHIGQDVLVSDGEIIEPT